MVKRTDNTSIKRQGQQYRQHIRQKTGSKIQTNTFTKRQGQKNRQNIHQKTGSKEQTTHPPRQSQKYR